MATTKQVSASRNANDRRRWTRWSLRGLLLVMTLFGICLGYEVNWIHQRRALAVEQAARFDMGPKSLVAQLFRDVPQDQPLGVTILNLLGEPSRPMVILVLWGQPASGEVDASAKAELQRAAELFPESGIAWVSGD